MNTMSVCAALLLVGTLNLTACSGGNSPAAPVPPAPVANAAATPTPSPAPKPVVPAEVTLISRYNGGTYEQAHFSFRYMSQDQYTTFNVYEIEFEGHPENPPWQPLDDAFGVQVISGDNSLIYDLGLKNCTDIQSKSSADKNVYPLAWLENSDANPSTHKAEKKSKVQVGHCYLVYSNNDEGRVVALFHVKDTVEHTSVTIDQINLVDDLRGGPRYKHEP